MFGQIYTRSWMALKWIYTTGGTIDFWYVWNVWIILNNFSSEDYIVSEWDRIAQIVFHTIEKFDPEMEEADELSDTNRWDAGYGSSGK
jgi:dUTP pyrophosphatase